MRGKMFRKIVVFGIMMLFVGATVLSASMVTPTLNNQSSVDRVSLVYQEIESMRGSHPEIGLEGYSPHDPILIDGDSDFASQAASEGWSGDGTVGNPYIIENYDINASNANGVEIRNTTIYFVIRSCVIHDGYGHGYYDYDGIRFYNVVNANVENCIIYNNVDGVKLLYYSSNNSISTNRIHNNDESGVTIGTSSNNNHIHENLIYDNHYDIKIDSSSYNNYIYENQIYNSLGGINLDTSAYNNYIYENHIYDNSYGVYLDTSSYNNIYSNDIYDNSLAGIMGESSPNNCVYENQIYNNGHNNGYGAIHLRSSSNNNIYLNEIYNNYGWVYAAVYLRSSSNNNIYLNEIHNNLGYSVCLEISSNNCIYENQIYDNGYGIEIHTSSTNNIYLNNFNNNHNVYCYDSSINIWNTPEQITYTYKGSTFTNYLGNHWNDYNGSDADGDGIGDTPYPIETTNDEDTYPLIEGFENYTTNETNQPPTVEIILPEENEVVSGTTTIQGTASDPDGDETLERVEVKIDDGSWEVAAGTTSWSYSWDTTMVDDGEHTIYARSYDGEDYSTVDSIVVTVNNGGNQPPNPPTLISPGTPTDTGFTVNTLTPTFQWNSVPNADYYGLYISKYPYGPSNIVFDSELDYGPIYGSSFTLPSGILVDGGKYRWNMRAYNTNGWSDFSNRLFFGVKLLGCSIILEKNGEEIDEVKVGEFFDIRVEIVDDYDIVAIRFSSDDSQDGNPTGEWTQWYGWDISEGDWHADTKIKEWSFATGGPREIWAEVKDTDDQTSKSSANIFAIFYFIHITDPHVKWGNGEIWHSDIQKIANMDPPPEFVLCTGDLVEYSQGLLGQRNYDELTEDLYEDRVFYIDSDHTIPIYFCPGNHDARWIAQIIHPYSFANYYSNIGPDYYTVSYKNCRIFSLNGGADIWPPRAGKILTPEGDGLDDKYTNELTSFLNDVANTDENIKIVMVHQPYKSPKADPKDGVFWNGREKFIQACSDYGVDLLLCGHLHNDGGIVSIGPNIKQVITNAVTATNQYRKIYVNPQSGKVEISNVESFNSIISGEVSCNTNVHIYDEQGNHNGPNETGGIEIQIPMSTYSYWRMQNDTLGINITYTEFMLEKKDGKDYTIVIEGLSDSKAQSDMNVTLYTRPVGGDWTKAVYSNIIMYNGSIATVNANQSIFNYTMTIVDPEETTRTVNPTYYEENSAPSKPNVLINPSNTAPEAECTCVANAIDPNGEDIYYWVDWGDGSNSGWLGPYESGENCTATHSWNSEGEYMLRVRTKDDYGFIGEWSESLTVNVDGTPPTVSMIKPEKALYIMDFKVRPYILRRKPLIVGKIEVAVSATDSRSGVDYVEFYIDNVLKATDTTKPYTWVWDEKTFGRHTIKAIAYDNVGNHATRGITVWKFF